MITQITFRSITAISIDTLKTGPHTRPDEYTIEEAVDHLIDESCYLMNVQLLLTILSHNPNINIGDAIERYLGIKPEAVYITIHSETYRVYSVPNLYIHERDIPTSDD